MQDNPIVPDGLKTETVISGLDTPWAIGFLPDKGMIFTERGGKVSIYRDGKQTVVGRINSSEIGEGGLLGVAVDPEFEKNNYVYFYYTFGSRNRISRFVLANEILESEFILIDNIPSASIHNGGRLKFGPDGLLYATAGDSANPSTAQDINSLSGKILRLNKDGTIPDDNPFKNYIYSYGHRNPQGLAWDEKGIMFESEHGPSSHDEINIIVKGGNYGWPKTCDVQDNGTVLPIRCYTEFTLAPSGASYYEGALYVAALRGSELRKISLDKNGKIAKEEVFVSGFGRIRESVVQDGYLYFSTSNLDGRGIPKQGDDKIVKVKI